MHRLKWTFPGVLCFFLIILAAITYLVGMANIYLFGIDALTNASVTYNMLARHDYLHLFSGDFLEPFLDKPPLLFWLNTFSINLFGLNHFAYRIPTFLCSLLGIYSTYQLGKLLYSFRVGCVAAVVLGTSIAYFHTTHDIRCDNILTNFLVFSVWQYRLYFNNHRKLNFFLASTGTALALLSKGPIALIVTAAVFGPEMVRRRSWNWLFQRIWLAGAVWVLILLMPMLTGLYDQYELQGIKFFFWTQSFGRVTGSSPWNNKTDPLFLFHSFAWAILPWTFAFLYGLANKLVNLWHGNKTEIMTLSGFALPLVCLSFSNYKLPHYAYVVLPYAAVLAGLGIDLALSSKGKLKHPLIYLQTATICLFAGVILTFAFWITPIKSYSAWLFVALCLVFPIPIFFIKDNLYKILVFPALAISTQFIVVNTQIFTKLDEFVLEKSVHQYVQNHSIPLDSLYIFNSDVPGLNFYLNYKVPHISQTDQINEAIEKNRGSIWILTSDEANYNVLKKKFSVETVQELKTYEITRLKYNFLDPNQRSKFVEKSYLVRIDKSLTAHS